LQYFFFSQDLFEIDANTVCIHMTHKKNMSREVPNMETPIVSTTNHEGYGTWPDLEDDTLDIAPRSELSILLTSSFPLICTSILQFAQVAIALLFVGRLGKDELAAVSLACLTANVTGWAVFQGLASALDTLCPQAYGAGLKKAVGLHTQRMALLLLCISIPVALFW
jgi:Na+-driven multidrug efflux pump